MLEKKPAKLSAYIGTDKQATFRLAILFPFRGKHHRNVVLFSLKKVGTLWGQFEKSKNKNAAFVRLSGTGWGHQK